MNFNNVIIQNPNLSHANIKSQFLKEGDQVLVRIISDKGNGKYLGSVAGTRVNFYSSKNLTVGQSFLANIKISDKVISLVPQKINNVSVENELKLISINNDSISSNPEQIVQNEQLLQFMQNIGIYPDNLSFNLVMNMKMLGMKFDSALMNKLHDFSLKFSGKEYKALEIALNLYSKGISFSEEDVLKMILELEQDDNENKSDDSQIITKSQNNQGYILLKEEIKSFFYKLLNILPDEKSFSNIETLNSENNKYDILSISNNLGFRKDISGIGSWILLPYEILNNEQKVGGGIFRILLSNEQKIIKFCVELNKDLDEYNFCLLFENNLCKTIKVNALQDGNEIKSKSDFMTNLNKKIEEAKLNIKTEWISKELISGNANMGEELCFIGGTV